MFCPLDIRPDVTQSKKYKEIKELSDFGEELKSNGTNIFFNRREISLITDILGYKEREEKIFKLITKKQKLFEYKYNYFNVNKKRIKEAAIYRPYDHLQASGFTFENKAKKETYNVKLTEKLDFIEHADISKYDFKALYWNMNMTFTWKDRQFYVSPTGFIEQYNEALKKKPVLNLSEKTNILSEYYNTLNDVNERVICSEDVWWKMNNKQKSYVFFIQNKNNPKALHFSQDDHLA